MRKVLFISAMIFVSQVFAQESAISVSSASASSFSMDKSTVEVKLQNRTANFNAGPSYNGKNNANIFKLSFVNEFAQMSSFSVGTNFMKRDFQSVSDDRTSSATGLGDIELGIKTAMEFDSFNLTYGADATLSLAAARDPGLNSNGNNFSGYSSIAPFVGMESYVGKIGVGGKVSYRQISQINKEMPDTYAPTNSESGARFESAPEINLDGHIEVPLYKSLDIGLKAGIGKMAPVTRGQFFDNPENSYRGGIYANVKVDKESTITVDFASRNEKIPYEQNSTDFTLGLRKTL